MVACEGVIKTFGTHRVLDRVDLQVYPGEIVALLGASGSGKTTLLRCINALTPIDGGRLTVNGLDVAGNARTQRQIRRRAGMVFQQFNLFPHLTAVQNVMFGLKHALGQRPAAARREADRWLQRVGLADKGMALPHTLSGGQQQRVAIARALACQPALMLFDEPTSSLDPSLRHEVLDVMRDLARAGMTMIIVTHELAFAREAATRWVFLEAGRVMHDDTPDALLRDRPGAALRRYLQHHPLSMHAAQLCEASRTV
ncbi:MAG: ATP-binding cassette domain-containing protein [Burkholderiaceae bacterium]|nr:ATP-binding cassette domain-containing protein [Burkholderiaceae bacterium]